MQQHRQRQYRAEIRRAEVRCCMAVFYQAAFSFQPIEQGSCRWRLQYTCHRPRDRGLIYEFQLAVEDVLLVRIEADDEATQDPQATLLNLTNLLDIVSSKILELARSLQCFSRRRLDSDEHIHEVGLNHGFHQFRAVRQINGRLGIERKRTTVPLLPPR